jgi:hypothetical protein
LEDVALAGVGVGFGHCSCFAFRNRAPGYNATSLVCARVFREPGGETKWHEAYHSECISDGCRVDAISCGSFHQNH